MSSYLRDTTLAFKKANEINGFVRSGMSISFISYGMAVEFFLPSDRCLLTSKNSSAFYFCFKASSALGRLQSLFANGFGCYLPGNDN
jgi:hypothetical protein